MTTPLSPAERQAEAVRQVVEELGKARSKFADFPTTHHGHSVLREELDELWEEVRSKTSTKASMRAEAMQVGAMALRFMVDLCDPE